MPSAAVPGWMENWRPPSSWRHLATLPAERLPDLMAELDNRVWYAALMDVLDDGPEPREEQERARARRP
ncbi:hypothetical protein LRB11_14075 [Ectothiorhodospira haloalkaliphila]|uniref:hypothetical protein n=1 Tax=Ectothiorhodospira haloalkaliphila TaxID=421628 RepID=UPI001EE8D2C2|nr:hypothetical protein [Ectothiorhodospira haloalkaliphila]MCG5526048.1 hypothetical protein [Ectothiorhodospira haloalkaliphila]